MKDKSERWVSGGDGLKWCVSEECQDVAVYFKKLVFFIIAYIYRDSLEKPIFLKRAPRSWLVFLLCRQAKGRFA